MGLFLFILVMEVVRVSSFFTAESAGIWEFELCSTVFLFVKKYNNCLLTSGKDEVDISKGRNLWH